jgi:hypothetical protein
MQFVVPARFPNLVYKAAKKRGVVSNTRYLQEALCAALARDLDIPIEQLLLELPPPRGAATRLRKRGKIPDRGRDYVIETVR